MANTFTNLELLYNVHLGIIDEIDWKVDELEQCILKKVWRAHIVGRVELVLAE